MARILIADDHDLVREMLAHCLVAHAVGEVVQAADADGVMRLLQMPGSFDLVLLDYNMPGMEGMAGLDRVLEAGGGAAVAMISGEMSRELVEEALSRGARGFVSKSLLPEAFVQGVRTMIAGESFAPLAGMARSEETALSLREMDVLRGICAGKSNKEIARDFALQEVTVKLHVKTMSRKLGARNRTHAAMIARNRKLI